MIQTNRDKGMIQPNCFFQKRTLTRHTAEHSFPTIPARPMAKQTTSFLSQKRRLVSSSSSKQEKWLSADMAEKAAAKYKDAIIPAPTVNTTGS